MYLVTVKCYEDEEYTARMLVSGENYTQAMSKIAELCGDEHILECSIICIGDEFGTVDLTEKQYKSLKNILGYEEENNG